MEWADETIFRLRELWDEGHSTAEIARRLGVSKNAVVGKAHRLDLPGRPSPIRREADGSFTRVPRPPRPARVPANTLPPLPSVTAPAPLPPPALRRLDQPGAAPPTAAPRPAPAPIAKDPPPAPAQVEAPQQPLPRPVGRIVSCCWPIGEPGSRSFRFCDGKSIPGKPYCQQHAEMAYVKVRRKLRVPDEAIAA